MRLRRFIAGLLICLITSPAWAGSGTITVLDSGGVTRTFDVITDASSHFVSMMGVCDGSAAAQCAAVKAASTAAVAGDPALVVAVSPNNSVAITGTVTANAGTGTLNVAPQAPTLDATATGTVTAVNNAVTVSSQGTGAVGAVVTANTNITLIFEGSVDGANWATVNAYPVGGGASITSTSSGGTGSWTIPSAGLNKVRARVTAAGATPTATVTLDAGAGSSQTSVAVSPTAGNFNVTASQGGAPWSANITQFGSNAVVTGTGVSGNGIPRVTVSNDSTVTANAGTGTFTTSDSHFPAAAALSDALSNPTTIQIGSDLLGWDATNSVWRRLQVDAGTGTLKVDASAATVTVTGTVTTTPPSNASTNVTQFGGTNISTGTGAGGAGIPRVTISNDSSLAANQSVNVAQVGGNTVATAANGVQEVGIFDGTNLAKVQPASTTPAAADLALTAALSPNSLGCAGQSIANTLTKPINNAGSANNLLLVSGVSAKKIYVCAINVGPVAAAVNVALVEGTTTTNPCDTGTAGMAGGATAATGWQFPANGGLTLGSGVGIVAKEATAADNMCLFFSTGVQVSGTVTYAQF